jgi:hypothetical protein
MMMFVTVLGGKEYSVGYAVLPESFPNLLQTAQTDDRLFSDNKQAMNTLFFDSHYY